MPEILQAQKPEAADVQADVSRVCKRIPPLWDLRNYVAVNPFLGFSSRPLAEAAREIGDGLNARVLPGLDYYRSRWIQGDFSKGDLEQAAGRSGHDAAMLLAILKGRADCPKRPCSAVPTFAQRHDRRFGTEWNDAVIRQIARWCAVYLSGGGASWKLPDDGRGLYASWVDAARVDRSLEIAGLSGWRAFARSLPEDPDRAIAQMLLKLGVPDSTREGYFYSLLGGLYGWASFLRRAPWAGGDDGPGALADLLAIRICADAAVAGLAPTDGPGSDSGTGDDQADRAEVDDESVRLVFQEALEDAFTRRLLGTLSPAPKPSARPRPMVQAVFCIDVRSEPLRRHLEVQADGIETRGFAGFFGVSLDWQDSARCPVLLKPGVSLASGDPAPGLSIPGTVKTLQVAPAAAFSFVELLGVAYGLGLAGDALTAVPGPRDREATARFNLEPDGRGGGIALDVRLDMACGILKNMGLRKTFARVVLLCGHTGRCSNNPHAAGLDCGACGGHGGAINARVAAAILNDPQVREGLTTRGWRVPADTHFLPAVHDTTADVVTLLDEDQAPPYHAPDLQRLRGWLAGAGAAVRAERAPSLGLGSAPLTLLDRLFRRRSRDSSEVRPEWALARNAAFVAARRDRTRGADLQGRAFLHEYDAATDPDDSILTLILAAPMVVASWINLQYFASTVDNRVFGCGTKTLHNRVGDLGVDLGNGGDLRTGLAAQSVHGADGRWYHEPLRLQVVVEAEPARIEGVLSNQPGVRDLVQNGWVRLFALDPQGSCVWLRTPDEGWRRVGDHDPATVPVPVGEALAAV